MPLKRTLAAVALLAAVAAQAARPARPAGICQKPSIVGVHWIFGNDGLNWTLSMEVAVKSGSSAGYVRVVDDYDPEGFDFSASGQVQTGLGAPVTEWGQADVRQMPVVAENGCGKSVVTLKVTAPHAGWWGKQQYFSCADFIIIDNRGSGERLHSISPPGAVFGSSFRGRHKTASVKLVDNPYPAAGTKKDMLEAAAKWPGSAYYKSVVNGKIWLYDEMRRLPDECPASLIFVVGYSQGAQVAGDVILGGNWQNFGGLMLFGDPYFNPGDPNARGSFFRSEHGSLGVRPATDPSPYIRTYCHFGDPVCQGLQWWPPYRFSHHSNYGLLGEPQSAAKHFTAVWG